MNLKKSTFIPLLTLLLSLTVKTSAQDTLSYLLESGFTANNGSNPYYFIVNRQGLIDPGKDNLWLQSEISYKTKISDSISANGGLDIFFRNFGDNAVYLNKGYLILNAGFLSLKGGKWVSYYGDSNPLLSSGGIIWSGNAPLMPRIALETNRFVSVPLTKGYVEFKTGIIHGWFGNDPYVKDAYLHHKYLYLRFGGRLPVHLQYGLQHFAQWGGVSSDPQIGSLPDNFSTFVKVFLARGGSTDVPQEESNHATGNHLGSHNLRLDISLKKTELTIYWQTLFEDGSGLRLRNIRDGLWGINVDFKQFSHISTLTLEYLNTTDQSGKTDEYYVNGVLHYAGGNDNYFNNWLYWSGWSYKGYTIGTPLISSPILLPAGDKPTFVNNKVRAFHAGLKGSFNNIDYIILYTFSENFGTNQFPFDNRCDQHSVLLKISAWKIIPWGLTPSAEIAFDKGKPYGDNIGVLLSLKKEGFIKHCK